MHNDKPFTKTASLYDYIYAKKQYYYEARVIDKLIRYHKIHGKTLLDLGCGTGKHCIELARLGYSPTGIDCSTPMLSVAKRNSKASGYSLRFVRAHIGSYQAKKEVDTVVSLFHVLSYQLTDAAVLKFFQTAGRCVRPGGLFIFDCWYGPGVFFLTPKDSSQMIQCRNLHIKKNKKSVWDKKHNVVHVYHTIYEHGIKRPPTRELHSMRYFFLPELIDFLSTAGFRLLEWGKLGSPLVSINKKPPWSIWLVAQKNA